MITVQDEARLVFLAGRSWAQILGGDIIVLKPSACTAGCAGYRNATLRCGSILTQKGIRTSSRYESIV